MDFEENNIIEVNNIRDIPTITSEIKGLYNQFANITLAFYIEVGRRLTEAKELLPFGEWGRWLEENFEFSQRTANNMMRCFEEYGDTQITLFGAVTNSQTFANLSAVKALKLLALEPDEREKFVDENPVDEMSVRELEKAIREKNEAEKKADEMAEEVGRLESENTDLEAELENVRSSLEEVMRSSGDLETAKNELTAAQKERDELLTKLDKAKAAAKKAKDELKELKENPEIPEDVMKTVKEEAEKKAAEAQKTETDKMIELSNKKIEALQAKAEAAKKELAEANARKEELEKRIKMMSPEMIAFKSAFENLQEDVNKMVTAYQTLSMSAPENAEKFKPAIKQLISRLEF